MALAAKNYSKKKQDAPQGGTHMARLVGLTDLGHQPGFEYQGKEIESAFKVDFTYELPNSTMEDGRPHWVTETVKVNDFEATKPGGITSTMMARVRSIDPENESDNGKDLTKLLGKPCMVTVTISDKGYANVKGQAAVTAIPMGMEVPPLANDTFSFDMDSPDMDRWEAFPEFKQDIIKRALNFEETELFKQLSLDGEL